VRALCDFAVSLTRRPAGVELADVEAVRAHGWSDAAIHDAIQVIAYFNYINRVAEGVGIEPEADWLVVDGAGGKRLVPPGDGEERLPTA
jgi:uncharacterized peroxidase-related enzyme